MQKVNIIEDKNLQFKFQKILSLIDEIIENILQELSLSNEKKEILLNKIFKLK